MSEPAPRLSAEQLNVLMSPLRRSRIKTRSQGGTNLFYLEGWDIRAMLIRVFGFGGFSVDLLEVRILNSEQVPKSRGDGTNWRVSAMARVRLHILSLGATYTEAAVSSQDNSNYGDAADFAVKTAETDALKRAATNLGTQFGLSLYNGGSTADVVRAILRNDDQAWALGTKPTLNEAGARIVDEPWEGEVTPDGTPLVGSIDNPARTPEEAEAMLSRALGATPVEPSGAPE